MGDWESVKAENLIRHSNGTYYLRAKVAGKVVRRSLKTKNLEAAKLARNDLLALLRAQAGKPGETTAQAIELTRAWYGKRDVKPRSASYREEMLGIVARTLPDKPPRLWTEKDLEKWWESPEISRYSPGRRNNLLGTLRKLIALCELPRDPSAKIERVSAARYPEKLSAPFSRCMDSPSSKVVSFKLIDVLRFLFTVQSGVRVTRVIPKGDK